MVNYQYIIGMPIEPGIQMKKLIDEPNFTISLCSVRYN